MPRVDFAPENKQAVGTNYDYPKMKLKVGERARIIVGLEAPWSEYVHELRAPQIINGEPVMVEVENRGKKSREPKMDFISKPICLGDATILADKGLDPKNCPVCRLAKEHPDMTGAPKIRYAMHIIRYRTKQGTWDVQTPFSVELLVWGFTAGRFNTIADIREEFGDLREHDLLLGPCEPPELMQKFDVKAGNKAVWREDKANTRLVLETFKNNQIPDLSIACGSKKKAEWLEQDVEKILERWDEFSAITRKASARDTSSLDEGLSNILDNDEDDDINETLESVTPAKASAKTEADDDLDSLLSGDDAPTIAEVDEEESLEDLLSAAAGDEEPAKPAKKRTTAAKSEPAKVTAPADDIDVEDLLADLD